MPAKNEDLHGNVPDKSNVALLLIDVINDLEFESGEELLRHALPMAERLAALKRRAKEAGVPVIYVNDNFGKWQSDFKKILEHCLKDDVRGRPLAELLRPEETTTTSSSSRSTPASSRPRSTSCSTTSRPGRSS